jgi:phosphoribosylformimino-5-aminoimidazole carboxamide ribotide isomerase
MHFPLQLIPVIDLQQGLVVRAAGGRRHEYRPLVGKLAGDARPVTVAQALVRLNFRLAYVADLDAIQGSDPAWSIYETLLEAGLQLWVDAGISDVGRIWALAEFNRPTPLAGIIAGLESLPSWDLLRTMHDVLGPERLFFSLDLKAGRPLTRWPEPVADAEEMAGEAVACGVRQMIVLDLARVGSSAGAGSLDLCRAIHERWPDLRLISGGGVRSRADLVALADAGCQAALVASALHDGELIP